MNHFTIKDIENISGIKAHTLRIWEKRYGIIKPKRKESKHRFYDNEDLKHVLRITHLYNNGHKISAIATMQKDELKHHDLKETSSEFASIKILLEATLDLNEHAFTETFEKIINEKGLENAMLKVAYPYFEKIGMLWLNNKTLPAQERFASNIVVKKIINEIDKLKHTKKFNNNAIALFTPPHEHHEIPLLFMHYMLKKSGKTVYYVGTNTGLDILNAFVEANSCNALYFHMITSLSTERIDEYLKQLSEKFINHTIVMSGKLAGSVSVKMKNLNLLTSLNDMIEFGEGKAKIVNQHFL